MTPLERLKSWCIHARNNYPDNQRTHYTDIEKLIAAYEIAKGVISGDGEGDLGRWDAAVKELEE